MTTNYGITGDTYERTSHIAYRRSESATYRADLTLFPIGYRVSARWTDGVKSATPEEFGIPKAVVKKANAMANRLARKLQGDYA